MKSDPWSPVWVRLKAYQTPQHCTVAYNFQRQDFTTLESYQGGNYFTFHRDNHEVNMEIQCLPYKEIL